MEVTIEPSSLVSIFISINICRIDLSYILEAFLKFSAFVTVKLQREHIYLSALNSSLSSYAMIKLDEIFFQSINLFDQSVISSAGIKLSTTV